MIRPRFKKMLGDLWNARARSSLCVIAMATGLAGVTAIVCAYAILMREMDANYMQTNPASALITTTAVTDDMVQAIRQLPGVGTVERRGEVRARIETAPGIWKTLWLFAIDDFHRLELNTFTPEAGHWPPQSGEILLEREALRVALAAIGDEVRVRIPGHDIERLQLGGTLHDPGQAPAWMEGWAYGYVSLSTLTLLGQPTFNQILLQVAEKQTDVAHIRAIVASVTAWLAQQGYPVSRVALPEPGHHPHQSQLRALLFLLQSFGGLALVLSSILVVNLISAMLAQQSRQIGVMKAIGASTCQIAGMYCSGVAVLGALAVIIGLPAGVLCARGYAGIAAKMLNFTIMNDAVPLQIYLGLGLLGLLTPLFTALYPILRGSRVTVRESLTDYGLNAKGFGRSRLDRIVRRIPCLPRSLSLAIRNTFRRKGRMALTFGTLAIGGALFITAFNLGASIKETIRMQQAALGYDVEVSLREPVPLDRIAQVVGLVPGVTNFEGWGESRAALSYPDGSDGNEFALVAPLADTPLLHLPVLQGRWLAPDDHQAMVVNHILLDREPTLRVGDTVTIRLGGQLYRRQIVGVVKQIGPPVAYTNFEQQKAVSGVISGQAGAVRNLRIVTSERSGATHQAVITQLENALAASGIDVLSIVSIFEYQAALEAHFLVLTMIVLLMALLTVIVGGLGLVTTMSLQTLERTREIGVMRTIGASTRTLLSLLMLESALIGFLSWLPAVVLALPLSRQIGNMFGQIFFDTPLDYGVAAFAAPLWLAVVLFCSVVATFIPARMATRLTIRETLAYE